jgi:hypothetical protein
MENFEAKPQVNLENEANLFEGDTQDIVEELKNADLDVMSPEKKESILKKGELILGSIFTAVGLTGGGFVLEKMMSYSIDTPDKALLLLGVLLGGVASMRLGTKMVETSIG